MPVSLSPVLHRVQWWIFAAVLVADVLDLLDSTVTNIAAPSIVHDLHANASLVPWLGLSCTRSRSGRCWSSADG